MTGFVGEVKKIAAEAEKIEQFVLAGLKTLEADPHAVKMLEIIGLQGFAQELLLGMTGIDKYIGIIKLLATIGAGVKFVPADSKTYGQWVDSSDPAARQD